MALWYTSFILPLAAGGILPGMMGSSVTEWSFVTRPDIRPPRLSIVKHHSDLLAKGYWFVAPYADLGAQSGAPGLCQIGPHIYDGNGDLVWSGACDVHNRNSFDFKTWRWNEQTGLSFAIEGQATNSLDMWHKQGAGIVLNDSYTAVDAVDPPADATPFNFHEFSRLQDGSGALMLYDGQSNVTDDQTGKEILVWDGGFVELDREGRETLRWRALDHIDFSETTATRPEDPSQEWDWLHPNSVDKDGDGNYLVSGRHTDCIYKVSAEGGGITWRLGGTHSSIDMVDFTFSRQHDARFMPPGALSGTGEIISLLNNAGDTHSRSSNTSAAYLLQVDSTKRAARLLKQWPRPDGRLGVYRGNVQVIENGNVVVHWGDRGRITEFNEGGLVLQEIEMLPSHLGTYRAYKLEFVGEPQEPIMLSCSSYAASIGLNATVCHVSWNGATEVEHWEIWDGASNGNIALARARRAGFETTLVFGGEYRELFARAIAVGGSVLGASETATSELQNNISGYTPLEHNTAPSTKHEQNEEPIRQHSHGHVEWLSRAAPDAHWTVFAYFFCGLVLGAALMAFSRNCHSGLAGSQMA